MREDAVKKVAYGWSDGGKYERNLRLAVEEYEVRAAGRVALRRLAVGAGLLVSAISLGRAIAPDTAVNADLGRALLALGATGIFYFVSDYLLGWLRIGVAERHRVAGYEIEWVLNGEGEDGKASAAQMGRPEAAFQPFWR